MERGGAGNGVRRRGREGEGESVIGQCRDERQCRQERRRQSFCCEEDGRVKERGNWRESAI